MPGKEEQHLLRPDGGPWHQARPSEGPALEPLAERAARVQHLDDVGGCHGVVGNGDAGAGGEPGAR
eukprot:5795578-Alexandrium_andersonii.AAC.1